MAVVFLCVLVAAPFSGVLSASSDGRSQEKPNLSFGAIYRQTNFISDIPGHALVEDKFLRNPWGLAYRNDSPFWMVNNTSPFLSLYRGDVAGSPLVKNPAMSLVGLDSIPTVAPVPHLATAVVANTTNDFVVSGADLPPAPAHFIFASEWGILNAWQPFFGSATFVAKFVQGHMHTGLAIANDGSRNLLYAADFKNGKVDVFDGGFNLTTVPGNFATDSAVPAGYHPYNIQNINGSLYVTYAEFNVHSKRPNSGVGKGYVRKFDANGVRDTNFKINNGVFDEENTRLNAPWGLALAPSNFGPFSNKLLVGNSGDVFPSGSSVVGFDPATGVYVGHMVDEGGASLRIQNLKSLVFGNGVNAGDTNILYFSAGIFSETHSLFGSLKPVTGIPATTIKFSETQHFIFEPAGHFDVPIVRTGDVSGTSTVNYATVDASRDLQIALGKLTFNPGETTKTVRVLISDDEQWEAGTTATFDFVLSNPTNAGLTQPNTTRLSIQDDEFDTPGSPPNANDDPGRFVRQHYYDFLNRVPDPSGFAFWVNEITSCTTQQCVERKRIHVSAAFFLSLEFQRTGMLAFLTHRLTDNNNFLPRYGPFMRDVQQLQRNYVFLAPGADAILEQNKQEFFNDFVVKPEFVARFGGLSNETYVDTLLSLRNVPFTQAERNALVNGLNGGTETRATVLRKIVENEAFKQSQFNTAFVYLEYAGYLRRNPDDFPDNNFSGFNFWLDKLNSFNGDYIASEMVKAFITSTEYRARFGPP